MKEGKLGILSAILASTCCVLPLLLATVGLGGLGLGSFFGVYHWLFLGAGVLLLSLAWVMHWKESKACALGECSPKKLKQSRLLLIFSTLVVLYFGGTSFRVAAQAEALKRQPKSALAKQESKVLVSLTLPVKGMTCSSCEKKIEHSVKRLPGIRKVKASAAASSVAIQYEKGAVTIAQIKDAIKKVGYEPL